MGQHKNQIVNQSTNAVLMVRPTTFAFDSQTASSNAFQTDLPISPQNLIAQAIEEFEGAVAALRAAGINVTVFDQESDEPRPSAVFPNNWLSMWPDGVVYTYPMATPSRRVERDSRILDLLSQKYKIDRTFDISAAEFSQQYLESTGVMVFDHMQKVAYGCISERCNEALFIRHCEKLGYRPLTFNAIDEYGMAIYHTNVMMGIQTATAVICSESIQDLMQREHVINRLSSTRDVIDISFAQLQQYCGNVLELLNDANDRFLVMSTTAYNGFTAEQLALLSADKTIFPLDIPTLETVGGGSARCMLAEIFLPTKGSAGMLSQNEMITTELPVATR